MKSLLYVVNLALTEWYLLVLRYVCFQVYIKIFQFYGQIDLCPWETTEPRKQVPGQSLDYEITRLARSEVNTE